MIEVSPPHPAGLDSAALLEACDIERGRASGPGGQHRNKVETAIRLVHRPTGVRASASERRRQSENLARAVFRLRTALALEVRCDRGDEGAPSALWRSRTVGGRITCSADHADFPAMLADALDALDAARDDAKQAAARLGVSISQLVKLLAKEPAALARVNDQRRQRGLHALR